MTTNVGIIGCGSISRFHHEGCAKAGARIAHVCDVRRQAAEEVATRYGARASEDYRAVLDDPQVQLVSVLAPASLHREICLAALAAGKGVICEKTLSNGPTSSLEIAQAADRSGLFFATAFMKRFFPAAVQAKSLLADMGRVTSIHARSWQPSGSLWGAKLPDEYTHHPSFVQRGYGGGALVCAGSHILDLIHWYGGRPTSAYGRTWTREGLDFDVQANALLGLPGGGAAHLEAFWHPFSHVGFERNGWDERLEINAERGRLDLSTVLWNQPEKNGALLTHQDAATGRVTEYRYPAVNPFDLEMAEMLRRFEAGEPGAPSAWDGCVVDELISAITRSAESGHALPLEWRDASTWPSSPQ